jgi:hypothetical protein
MELFLSTKWNNPIKCSFVERNNPIPKTQHLEKYLEPSQYNLNKLRVAAQNKDVFGSDTIVPEKET